MDFEWKEINQKIDVLNPEESLKIKHTFKEFWSQSIKAILKNTSWKTKEVKNS